MPDDSWQSTMLSWPNNNAIKRRPNSIADKTDKSPCSNDGAGAFFVWGWGCVPVLRTT